LTAPGPAPALLPGDSLRQAERQRRQVDELVQHTQRLLRDAQRQRDETFWKPIQAASAAAWAAAVPGVQSNLWERVLGRLPPASLPPGARSRRMVERPRWTAHDVVLDVWPEVFAWGALLLPADLKPGERRPVVVCQHGLEGLPADTFNEDPASAAHRSYQAFAARLAERGFIVFAPHNPYRGGDAFRGLQRKLNPLGLSLFSVIVAQHERILEWLSAQPFVDPERIGFYGLSYGGKTAMRVPAVLNRYAVSICSADFNEWVMKNATVDSPYSYLFTEEYEIFEWNLGHTFNYAEMAACIAPRPFMVERGHHDGVAPDEWVAAEFARVRRFYTRLGIPERAEIEYFNGPHTIHGQGTFRFLHRHLNWPEPPPGPAR
jgi:cephalosporin-C deacetylase-like acetyl esterase